MKNNEVRLINGFPFVKYSRPHYPHEELLQRSAWFYQFMNQRRSVRNFSDKPIPREVVNNLILTASTAPSGAHKQPWTFCLIEDPEIKKKIRQAAEEEELKNYTERMSEEWLHDLQPLQTDWHKPFLEKAPCLIAVFKRLYEFNTDGSKSQNYYVSESVGLACGLLIAAIHHAGLVALTHTPSPMHFLSRILNRPENERPFLLIPVGYPEEETWVPDLTRKSLSEIAVNY